MAKINLAGFANSKNTDSMLKGCESATTVDASALTSSKNSNELLSGCTNLEEVNVGSNIPEQSQGMFDGTPDNKVIKTNDKKTEQQIENNKESLGLKDGSYKVTVVPPEPGDSLKIAYNDLDTKIPTLTKAGTYNLTIDCSGISIDKFTGDKSSDTSSELGTKLKAAEPGVLFNLKLINIDSNLTNATCMFNGCTAIKEINATSFTQITDTTNMFKGCAELTVVDTKYFTNVTDTTGMFLGCSNIVNIDISKFIAVSGTSNMFENCTKLSTINWGNIIPTISTDMFKGASALNKSITISSIEAKQWIDENASTMKLENYETISGESIEPPSEIKYESLDFYLPTFKAKTYTLTIDCNGVNADQFKGNNDTSLFGKKLSSVKEGTYFNLSLKNFNPSITDISYMFANCTKIVSMDCSNFENVANTSNMFENCTKLTEITWGSIQPETSTAMFNGASATKKIKVVGQAASNYILANTENMNLVNYSIEGVQIPSILNYDQLNKWIPNLDPGVYDLTIDCMNVSSDQFIGSNGEASPFAKKLNVEGVNFNLKIINVSSEINSTSSMFEGCTNIISVDISNFAEVVAATNMFKDCTSLSTIDISILTKASNTSNMFENCTKLSTITWGNIQPETNTAMFNGASANKKIKVANQKTASWINDKKAAMNLTGETIEVAFPSELKYNELDNWLPELNPGEYNLTINFDNVKVDQFAGTSYSNCSPFGKKLQAVKENVRLNLKLINITSELTNVNYMLSGCNNIVSIDISEFLNVTDALSMFEECHALSLITGMESITKIKNADKMFKGCMNIEEVDVSNFDKVISASYMFYKCLKLKFINTFVFAKLLNADNMFKECMNLKEIDVSAFTEVTSASNMFKDCSSLNTVYATNSNVFDKGADLIASPVKTVYTNKEVKEKIKSKLPSDVAYFSLKEKNTYKVTDLNDNTDINYNDKYIVGNLTTGGTINGATIKDGNITSTSLKINKSLITTNDAGDFIFSWS